LCEEIKQRADGASALRKNIGGKTKAVALKGAGWHKDVDCLSPGKTFKVVDSYENLSCLVQSVAFQDVRRVLLGSVSGTVMGTVFVSVVGVTVRVGARVR